MKDDENILSEIEKLVKERNKPKEEPVVKETPVEEPKVKVKDEEVTLSVSDLQKILSSPGAFTPETTKPKKKIKRATLQPLQQKQQLSEREQIALQIWKDAKTTSIICLIAMILPMITVLVTMFPEGLTIALLVAFGGLIYPAIVFAKMIATQAKLHQKYGLKPLLSQQRPQQCNRPGMQNQNNDDGFML